ncbi:MAG: type II toxin-antitoxin system PemK/MazF family toxin [Verrucomicrobia bacterium]|nr:type II toxin-antitoxin system PemK/MazF family toxin [Verrucomicrobiota bacterium]
MIHEGQVVLFRFPQTDQSAGKLRPAIVLRKLPGPHDDWLVCMVSAQLSQAIAGFDEVISPGSVDFQRSGLKTDSVIRVARLAVVQRGVLLGAVGEIGSDRLLRMKSKLADWLRGT